VFRPLFLLAVLSALSVTAGASEAQGSFCNIDYVKQVGRDVELHFIPYNGLFVRIKKRGEAVGPTDRIFEQDQGQMHRLYYNQQRPESAISKVMLFDGEEAVVGGDPHSGCIIRKAYDGNILGVEAEATVSFEGLAPQVTSRFFPAKSS
jgi:hypothetical protein